MKTLNTEKEDKYLGIGTRIRIQFCSDGMEKDFICILANTYEEDFLFQVITIEGYHAGSIEGYIKREFSSSDRERCNLCTWNHLKKELNQRVFPEITELKLID